MESLYRKYRPLTFESVVGQQHIVSTLEHAVTEGRLSHAYLFCGPRGTGKTTMARILAKSLLCEHAEAARAQGASGCMPDGDCPECRAIAEGTHPDVYELDAASRTGVDNVREEIVNSVSFAPVRGAYKVYIIDEVHMLTTAAFNALLKTLEEPPSHVVFILCTTDPQKILETILSRCQRFDFHRISDADLVARMRYVCEQEGFAFDDEALEIVAKHARGGMRDALSTLEQLSVFGDGAVRVADARALLGEVASTVLSEFACKIAVRDTVGLFGLVRAQVDEGNDLLELTRDLVGHMRDVYTAAIAGPKPELFDGTPEEVAAFVEEAKLFEGTDRLARALTTLDDAALEMRNASDPRLVLEIACTRLARPESDLTLEALAERIACLETQLAAGVPSRPMGAAGIAAATGAAGTPKPATAPQPASSAPTRPTHESVPWEKPSPVPQPAPSPKPAPAPKPVPVPQPVQAPKPTPTPQPQRPAAPAASSVAAAPDTPAVADAGELQRKWAEVVQKVIAAQPSRGALLQNARAQADDGSKLTVGFPKGSNFAVKMVTRADSQAVVLPIVCEVFGNRSIDYVMDGDATPASKHAAPAAPAPAPAPQPAPAPKPAVPSPQPAAPAPVQQAPAPQPPVDQASGPTIVPEPDVDAQRKAWEDEQVPYDDATIAAYGQDEEIPPFVAPAPNPIPAPTPASAAPAPAIASQPAPVPQPAAPAATPFAHAGAPAEETPQSEEEAKALIGSIFGAGVVFKDAD